MRALWKPQTSKRFFIRLSQSSLNCRYASTTAHDPLRILFCGSEAFSIASLRALYRERVEHPDSIASIDVVCRPGKRVGRGLKAVREGKKSLGPYKFGTCPKWIIVPIRAVARELTLPIHAIDTFTGWQVRSTRVWCL